MEGRLKEAVYGLAVGDAVGVPYEFKRRGSFQCAGMIGYGTHDQPAGTWSDDTSMTLATCASIKNMGKIDCEDIRRQFETWFYEKKYTPFGEVFDYGITCSQAIDNKKGKDDERSNGNGSLMRILPLAFVPDISDEQIAEVSAITHAHKISKEACIIYVRIAQEMLAGVSPQEAIEKHVSEKSILHRLRYIDRLEEKEIRSSGYVVDSFEAAMWSLLTTHSYKECIKKAVNLGDDTDTVAAIAGGLAGILYGIENIPKEWLEKLQSKENIDKCLW